MAGRIAVTRRLKKSSTSAKEGEQGGFGLRDFRLNEWIFDPGSHSLARGGEVVRLEHRAAALLLLLCERAGETVTQRDIIDRVWGGRHVSANSVPVVIGDLRRALGDDAKQPRFIETVTKGGYRLVTGVATLPSVPFMRRRPRMLIAAAGFAAAAFTLLILPRAGAAPVTTLAVEDVRNATGSSAYDTLAAASGGELIRRLAGHRDLVIARNGPSAMAAEARLTGKLVLWSGKPELLFEAREVRTGKLLWDGEVFVPEPRIPRALAGEADDLSRTMAKFRKGAS
jgi:DNA-binding winged helix-turn-helix (wHTH) protein